MKHTFKSNKNNQKGKILVEGIIFFLFWAALSFIFFLFIHLSGVDKKGVDESKWKEEPSYVVHNHIINLPIVSWTGRFNYVYHNWYVAKLDNEDYLINPSPIQQNVLCNMSLLPLLPTLPNDKPLFNLYDSSEMSNYVNVKTNIDLEVKKIPSNWINESKKEEMKNQCHDVDFSSNYVKYKNREVLELVRIIKP